MLARACGFIYPGEHTFVIQGLPVDDHVQCGGIRQQPVTWHPSRRIVRRPGRTGLAAPGELTARFGVPFNQAVDLSRTRHDPRARIDWVLDTPDGSSRGG